MVLLSPALTPRLQHTEARCWWRGPRGAFEHDGSTAQVDSFSAESREEAGVALKSQHHTHIMAASCLTAKIRSAQMSLGGWMGDPGVDCPPSPGSAWRCDPPPHQLLDRSPATPRTQQTAPRCGGPHALLPQTKTKTTCPDQDSSQGWAGEVGGQG